MIKGGNAIKIALVGNPNTGKTSIFNLLTGLNQRVSNYPGITVEKKTGFCKLDKHSLAEIVDLPGTYSLNPSSLDEEVVLDTLANPKNPDRPDAVIAVLDATNLKRNLYLYTQVADLGFPTILALNMSDQLYRRGMKVDVEQLSNKLGVPVVPINARKGEGIKELKQEVLQLRDRSPKTTFKVMQEAPELVRGAKDCLGIENDFAAWIIATHPTQLKFISPDQCKQLADIARDRDVDIKKQRIRETIKRYQAINELLNEVLEVTPENDRSLTGRIDRLVTHPVYGLITLFGLLFLIFQAIFSWAEVPMNFIDEAFMNWSNWLSTNLPSGMFTSLIAEGVIPGIAGVVIFVPQIALLFTFITLLEETGYMSRVVFLMDKVMRPFGLSGKSVVPLISGTACAIPAIMATRNIENWKERLVTILVTPFTTCSARLPVYTVLIGLVIPDKSWMGLNLQGMVLMLMYLVGFAAALLSAWLVSRIIKTKAPSSFVIEMPSYKIPYYRNVALTIWEKSKSFVTNAGKIILSVSIVLWVLATNGPDRYYENAEENAFKELSSTEQLSDQERAEVVASYKLKYSYVGIMGRAIEPVIEPLGYDWKVGISLISSFAAREIFVGSIATIYSVGTDDEKSVIERLKSVKDPKTGEPFFNLAVGLSLLMFYAFAMQCLSTFAVVKKETNSWLWPVAQMVFMTAFAYIVSLLTYQILK
ncbi:MAG: ferrous iron transport protein B [Bacteroidota bacterium]|nr:ferrous iron transport protein B [Bacteroidota bacterium]MDX5404131.1 ferrous iron transport protein B [Bacteroidota bacterium]MDX5447504.1 ferrous iron transport protein B [Bacteroidota bacterium]